MNRRGLLELIEEGENIQCEFKRQFTTPEKIAREMIAFANTKGGFIIFGVDDDREVVGVDSEKSEAELIIDAVENYCEPPLKYSIDYIEVFGKEVVVQQKLLFRVKFCFCFCFQLASVCYLGRESIHYGLPIVSYLPRFVLLCFAVRHKE